MIQVTLLMGQTLDGRIAKDSNHFPDWTEKADKKFFMEYTKKAGAIIMGSKTYDTIGKPLPNRKNIILEFQPRPSNHPDLIFTNDTPEKILQNLEKQGFSEVVLCGGMMVNTLFAQKKLIKKLIITVSPVIFGSGLGLFAPDVEMNLKLEKFEKLGNNSVALFYTVIS